MLFLMNKRWAVDPRCLSQSCLITLEGYKVIQHFGSSYCNILIYIPGIKNIMCLFIRVFNTRHNKY